MTEKIESKGKAGLTRRQFIHRAGAAAAAVGVTGRSPRRANPRARWSRLRWRRVRFSSNSPNSCRASWRGSE